jgi:hypothetical protein
MENALCKLHPQNLSGTWVWIVPHPSHPWSCCGCFHFGSPPEKNSFWIPYVKDCLFEDSFFLLCPHRTIGAPNAHPGIGTKILWKTSHIFRYGWLFPHVTVLNYDFYNSKHDILLNPRLRHDHGDNIEWVTWTRPCSRCIDNRFLNKIIFLPIQHPSLSNLYEKVRQPFHLILLAGPRASCHLPCLQCNFSSISCLRKKSWKNRKLSRKNIIHKVTG